MMVNGETGDGRRKTGIDIDNPIVGADLRVRPGQAQRPAPPLGYHLIGVK